MIASVGDEVFFHHKGVPKCGKVLCAGLHGCTVKSEKEEHKLKWNHIAGFKSRTPQTYKVVDRGDDAMIVEDQSGRRRLVHIPEEARSERLELEAQAKQSTKPKETVA
jgi:hypothetical protein